MLVPVVLFYLLLDWTALRAARDRAGAAAPARAASHAFTDECDDGARPVPARPAAGDADRWPLFYSVGLALFGFDLAVPVGVFTGLAMFIPYVGFGIGLLLALLAGVLQFAGWYGADRRWSSSTASARSSRASSSRRGWSASASA